MTVPSRIAPSFRVYVANSVGYWIKLSGGICCIYLYINIGIIIIVATIRYFDQRSAGRKVGKSKQEGSVSKI